MKKEPNQSIVIFDTTLRDGEQAPGYSMTLDEKLRMAKQLERLGVDIIEAGFAAASPGDFESVSNVLLAGLRTADLTSPDAAPIGTSQMGDAVTKAILKMVK